MSCRLERSPCASAFRPDCRGEHWPLSRPPARALCSRGGRTLRAPRPSLRSSPRTRLRSDRPVPPRRAWPGRSRIRHAPRPGLWLARSPRPASCQIASSDPRRRACSGLRVRSRTDRVTGRTGSAGPTRSGAGRSARRPRIAAGHCCDRTGGSAPGSSAPGHRRAAAPECCAACPSIPAQGLVERMVDPVVPALEFGKDMPSPQGCRHVSGGGGGE